jgi:hypothetical protein
MIKGVEGAGDTLHDLMMTDFTIYISVQYSQTLELSK